MEHMSVIHFSNIGSYHYNEISRRVGSVGSHYVLIMQ